MMKYFLSFIFLAISPNILATNFPPDETGPTYPEENSCIRSCNYSYDKDFEICQYVSTEHWKACTERAYQTLQECYRDCSK
ncbi:MAG: hypothetical protein HQK54_13495 [Oligoflexales bacterium]|nr:hypothetical protein [Oligoflexales bacterium]